MRDQRGRMRIPVEWDEQRFRAMDYDNSRDCARFRPIRCTNPSFPRVHDRQKRSTSQNRKIVAPRARLQPDPIRFMMQA